jgi:large conductance mechanosensitive channel
LPCAAISSIWRLLDTRLAFNAVVQALVDGVIMRLIAAFLGEPSFDALSIDVGGTSILYGTFLTALVQFVLVAFAVFLIVRAMNRLTLVWDAPPETSHTRLCPYCLSGIPTKATRCSSCTSAVEPVEGGSAPS